MDTKQKFIRTKDGAIIIFPLFIEHSKFKHFNPVSAGFCYVNPGLQRVDCFGSSVSLGLTCNIKEDTIQATQQIFGWEAVESLVHTNTEDSNG